MVGIVLIVLTPILIVPLIVGSRILTWAPGGSFAQMCALFTLKPILATPLMLAFAGSLGSGMRDLATLPVVLILAAPGIVISLALLLIYRSAAWREGRELLFFLLLLDCIRWGSTTLALALSRAPGLAGGLEGVLGFTGIGMPTVFAIFAWMLAKAALRQARNRAAPAAL